MPVVAAFLIGLLLLLAYLVAVLIGNQNQRTIIKTAIQSLFS